MANIVLGAGKVFFELEDASGVLAGGERYLAETPGFAISVTPETLEDWSSDGRIAEKLLDITTQVNRGGTLTLKDVIADNVALFVAGAKSAVTQSATPVVDEPITLYKDRWVQLGRSLANPTGVRNISAVNISTVAAPTTPLSAVTDYELDSALGRVRLLPGSAVVDATASLADYTPAAETRDRVASDQLGPKTGALRFIADNTAGTNRDLYIPKVQLAPDGELAWKSRDTVMQMQFQLRISTRAGYAQMYVDGRAA